MKDAKGHGSDPRGAHAEGVDQVGRASLVAPVWYHGSVIGEPGEGPVHVGSALAAKEALEARIGIPADGKGWSGDREYGKTLLAGQDTLDKLSKQGYPNNGGFLATGMNAAPPKKDYYIGDRPGGAGVFNAKSRTPIPLDAKPNIGRYQIVGHMNNSPTRPATDSGANRAASSRKGMSGGIYYKNIGEDVGSVSAVVPNKTFLRRAS